MSLRDALTRQKGARLVQGHDDALEGASVVVRVAEACRSARSVGAIMSGRHSPMLSMSPTLLSPRKTKPTIRTSSASPPPSPSLGDLPVNGAASPTMRPMRSQRATRAPPPAAGQEGNADATEIIDARERIDAQFHALERVAGSPAMMEPTMMPTISRSPAVIAASKPAEEEYKRAIVMLREELGRAREELQQLREKENPKTSPEDTDASRLQRALSNMSRLLAEVDELKQEKRNMQQAMDAQADELGKEVSARAKAQQDLIKFQSQLDKLDVQLQLQLQERTKERDDALHEVERDRRVILQYEAKLLDTISTYEEKLADKDSEAVDMARARFQYQKHVAELESKIAETISAYDEKIAGKDAELIEWARIRVECERKVGERDKKLSEQDEMVRKLRQELESLRSTAGEELRRQADEMLSGRATERKELENALESMRVMLHNSKVEQEKHLTHGRTLATRLIKLNEELELEKGTRQEVEKRLQLQKDREEALLADLENNAKKVSEAERAHGATRLALREANDCAAKLENRVRTLEQEHIAAVQREMDTRKDLSESAKMEAQHHISMLDSSQVRIASD